MKDHLHRDTLAVREGLHATHYGENSEALRNKEVAAIAIGNFLDVSGASEFVNVLGE